MYFVVRVFFDTTGKQSNSIQKFDTENEAMKRYFTILGTDIDNETYSFELVQVVYENGIVHASYTIDNRGVD